jgi:adenylate cyclase
VTTAATSASDSFQPRAGIDGPVGAGSVAPARPGRAQCRGPGGQAHRVPHRHQSRRHHHRRRRDIFGDGVNIATRLEALAEAGGICLGGSTYEQVRDKLDLAFEDMGEQQVKNTARPVRVYRVRLGVAPTAAASPVASRLSDKPSIAVLPFQNMSGDLEQEYFADGMVEEIITALSRIRWLFVMARNPSVTYKGQAVDIKQVGRELGVR